MFRRPSSYPSTNPDFNLPTDVELSDMSSRNSFQSTNSLDSSSSSSSSKWSLPKASLFTRRAFPPPWQKAQAPAEGTTSETEEEPEMGIMSVDVGADSDVTGRSPYGGQSEFGLGSSIGFAEDGGMPDVVREDMAAMEAAGFSAMQRRRGRRMTWSFGTLFGR